MLALSDPGGAGQWRPTKRSAIGGGRGQPTAVVKGLHAQSNSINLIIPLPFDVHSRGSTWTTLQRCRGLDAATLTFLDPRLLELWRLPDFLHHVTCLSELGARLPSTGRDPHVGSPPMRIYLQEDRSVQVTSQGIHISRNCWLFFLTDGQSGQEAADISTRLQQVVAAAEVDS